MAAARTKRTTQAPGRSHLSSRETGSHGEPEIRPRTRHASASAGMPWSSGNAPQRRSARREVGRRQGGTGAETDGDEEVGGPHTSEVVQGALLEVLEAVYEPTFYDGSYGFRRGRSAHDALRTLNQVLDRGEVSWILEADIESFFDSIDRKMLMEMLRERMVEISWSGSGEGPGGVTPRGYPTKAGQGERLAESKGGSLGSRLRGNGSQYGRGRHSQDKATRQRLPNDGQGGNSQDKATRQRLAKDGRGPNHGETTRQRRA